MKYLSYIALFFFFLVSCNEEEVEESQIPTWLEPRLEELENSGECYDCTLKRVTYNNEYIYHVYCGYWSCSHCEVYHSNGELVDWAVTDFGDFLENQERPVILWECPTETD